jgi:hypothetical protein
LSITVVHNLKKGVGLLLFGMKGGTALALHNDFDFVFLRRVWWPNLAGLGYGFARVGLSFSCYFLVLVHSTACAAAFLDPSPLSTQYSLPIFDHELAGGDVDVEAFHEQDSYADVGFRIRSQPDLVVEIGLLKTKGYLLEERKASDSDSMLGYGNHSSIAQIVLA